MTETSDAKRPLSLTISHYRCFGDSPQGFDSIKRVNLVVGRNNSGKSTLLDLVKSVVSRSLPVRPISKGKPVVVVEQTMDENSLKKVFRENVAEGGISGNHWTYASSFVGKPIKWRLVVQDEGLKSVVRNSTKLLSVDNEEPTHQLWDSVPRHLPTPFGAAAFVRLSADRDVHPEETLAKDGTATAGYKQVVSPTGINATALISEFIHNAALPRDLVEETLRQDLNGIFAGDGRFDRIEVQRTSDATWEVFLTEESKGRVALSDSGSGLKTIVLVLVLIRLVPKWDMHKARRVRAYVFAFEELENNLHPSLVRRLLNFLLDLARETEWTFFLTTHSSAAIDLLVGKDDVTVTHVVRKEAETLAVPVSSYLNHREILDDLGVRASDVLQANAIIWVEGESDRVYMRRWLDLATGKRLKEGVHYQCLEYGGKNLAHFSAAVPQSSSDENENDVEEEALAELVDMLRVNRNAIVLMDSDLNEDGTAIRATKQRVVDELKESGGMAWVTRGREVENYLPFEAVAEAFGLEADQAHQMKQFEKFNDYQDRIKGASGSTVPAAKVAFARRVTPHIEAFHLTRLDLRDQIEEVVRYLCRWNDFDAGEVLVIDEG